LGQQLSENKNLNGKSFNFGQKAGNNQTVLELIHQISNRYFENEKIQYEIIKQPSFHEAGLLQLDCAKANEDLSWEANLDFNQTANYTSDWYNNYKTRNMIEFTIKQLNNYCKAATETQLSWME